MLRINNSSLIQEIIDSAKLSTSSGVPTELVNQVVPVMEVNPKLLRRCNVLETAGRTAASSVTIYTVPTGKKFYLTSASLNYIKDALNDHATGITALVTCVIGGATKNLFIIPVITLTAQSGIINLNLPVPIELEAGTIVSIGAVTIGAGSFIRVVNIVGYTTDNSLA
jgi:hypothetical protein